MAHLLVPFAVFKDLASPRGCPECQNSLGSFHRSQSVTWKQALTTYSQVMTGQLVK